MKKYTVIAVILIVAGLFACIRYATSIINNKVVANAVLNYASDPLFASNNLLSELTGTKAELEMLDLCEGKAYFSLPHSEDWKLVRDRFTKRPEAIESTQSAEAPYELGEFVLPKRNVYFFRINSDDFQVNPDARIKVPFRRAIYAPTAYELASFLTNKVLMCGKAYFLAGQRGGLPLYMSNFGARVTVPGEPSLTRFAKAIIGEEKNPDSIAQKLLDFVTNEIEYDHDEQEWSDYRQVIKRANEVLMSRKATCASKAALYASLLEQVNSDYVFAYYPDHLAVFVSGQFPEENDLSIVYCGKRYYLAESTAPGFVIGETRVNMPGQYSLKTGWTHLQRPRDKDIPKAK